MIDLSTLPPRIGRLLEIDGQKPRADNPAGRPDRGWTGRE